MLIAHWTLRASSDLAQVVIAGFTVIGVLVSLYMSRRTLREVERDRQVRQTPYLMFERGGWQLIVGFVKAGPSIPGIEPSYAAKMFPSLSPDAESVRLARGEEPQFYGRLHNLGLGPAIEPRVVWIADEVQIGQETFAITDAKRKEPPYTAELNELPVVPRQLRTGDAAQLTRLPTFIEKDVEKKVSAVSGRLRITCTDLGGKGYSAEQEFRIFTAYADLPPTVHVTFSEVLQAMKP